ncbi:glycoside hydrolase family 97 N-terminal domain-containing protein, partial [Bacteroides acidifaciens]
MKKLKILLFLCVVACTLTVQAQKQFTLNSPDGKLQTTITVGDKLTYEICCNGRQILAPSPISMTLNNGEVWGEKAKLSGTSGKKVDQMIPSPFYRASELRDHYNELTLRFKKDWNVEFRAYNDGIAYRFVSRSKKPFNVVDETVDYRFPSDMVASVPYVKTGKDGDYDSQYFNSFENTYTTDPLSKLNKKRLMFLPLVVDAGEGVKICITESDLENYPGLYLSAAEGDNRLTGRFAPYPKKMVQGGHNRLQMLVKEHEAYIAKVDKPRNFPWRMSIVTTSDKDLAASNLSYLLAAPSRLTDLSWIKPGKVAWDWWNDWNLDGVDFVTGVNNPTYKAYIDFASANGIEYVILDEGWAVNLQADLMQVVKEINLKELVDYAATKNVGIILWAGYYAFERDMENVCRYYADMGVKGFKVDFM